MKNLLFILLASAFIFSSCKKDKQVEYKYEVTGTGGDYNLTFQNADNNTEQYASVGNGWTYTWKQEGTRWLYFSAQNNTASGTVTVKIYRDGEVMETNTSSGGYTIATVDGEY